MFASGVLVVLGGTIGITSMSNNYRNVRAWLVMGIGLTLLFGSVFTVVSVEPALLHQVSISGAGILLLAFAYSGRRRLAHIRHQIEQNGEVMIHD